METLTFQPAIAAAMLVSAGVAIFAPLIAAIWLSARTRVSAKYFAFGAAVFLVTQPLLRLSWFLPLQASLAPRLQASPAANLAFLVFASLTAGLFEEAGRWFGYRKMVKDDRSWRAGVMFGLGHGGIESILLVGVQLLVSVYLYMSVSRGFAVAVPDEARVAMVQQFAILTPALALLAGFERLCALTVHVGLSLLVLLGIRTDNARLLWGAIGVHTAFNLFAVLATQKLGPFYGELVALLFAVGAGVWIVKARAQLSAAAPSPASPRAPAAPRA